MIDRYNCVGHGGGRSFKVEGQGQEWESGGAGGIWGEAPRS